MAILHFFIFLISIAFQAYNAQKDHQFKQVFSFDVLIEEKYISALDQVCHIDVDIDWKSMLSEQQIDLYCQNKQFQSAGNLLAKRLLQFTTCTANYTECSMCDNLSDRQQEIKCRICVYNKTKKGVRPNGECQIIPDGQSYNVWGNIQGCDSSKCKCSSDKSTCGECLNPSDFIYPEFQTCEPICRQGRYIKGKMCLKCNPDGYYLSEIDKTCQLCTTLFDQCNVCTKSNCEKCQDGFGFDFLNQSKCILCSTGSVKVGDYCVKLPSGCKKIIESPLDLVNKKLVCDECSETEMVKKGDGTCVKCSDKTYYDPASQQCKKCTLQDCKYCPQNQCQTCTGNFQLINGKCEEPLSNCTNNPDDRKYVDKGVCTICPNDYNYNSDCTNFNNFCGQCLPCQLDNKTQFLSVDKCTDCNFPCKTCKNGSFCYECQQYGVTPNSSGVCKCTDIKKCLMCDKDGPCYKCPDDSNIFTKTNTQCGKSTTKRCTQGFKPIQNSQGGTNCYCQSANCQYCDFEDGSKCQICKDNFELKDEFCRQCPIGSQYDKINQKCVCSVQNCSQCSPTNFLQCSQCQDKFELTQDGFCRACPLNYSSDSSQQKCICQDINCLKCDQNDGSKCLECAQKYQLQPATQTCQKLADCNVQNCITCQSNSVTSCQKCSEGYKLDNTAINCIIAIDNCLELDQVNKYLCKVCFDNFIVAEGLCKCAQENCQNCSITNNICNQCESGYSWQGNKCQCNIPNCQSCDISPNYGNCKQCNNNYKLISNKNCICSVDNCSDCNSEDGSKCDQCQNGYVLDQTKKICNQCQLQNCQQCRSDDVNKCSVCQDGYEVNQDTFTCKIKIQFCTQLNSFDKTKCESCQQNYSPSIDKSKCECIFQNCNQCLVENSKCTKCEKGFFWNEKTNTCECNLKNCLECQTSPYGTCKKCNNGYQLTQEGVCECSVQNCQSCNRDDGKICDNCIDKYFLDSNNTQCTICDIKNCLTCKSNQPNKCEVCENGYKKDSNLLCQINIERCIQLNKQDFTICDQCQNNYQFNSSTKQCECKVNNCIQCQFDARTNTCKQCQSGFSWDSSKNDCICNISNCLECSTNDFGACKRCNEGFTQKQRDQCICSVDKCEKCNQLNGNTCEQCEKGYVQNQTKNLCKKCEVTNCLECANQNEKSCKQCQTGFSLENLGAECKIEIQNCLELDPNSSLKCKKCDQNFVLDENFNCKCQIDNCKDCKIYPDGTCIQCQQGFKQLQDKCVCDISNCKECDTQYYEKCQTCETNYLKSVKGDQCDCQVSNCSFCNQTNGKICDQCDQDYVFRDSEKKECWKCQVQNCLKCSSDNANVCEQCKNGYKQSIDSNKCEIALEKCIEFDDLDPNKCQKCEQNFKVDQNGKCTCKVQFCVDCNLKNESICMKCQDGFSQKNPNSDCECNLSNCLECDKNTFGKCEQCIQGFKLNSNKDGCDCSIQNCSQCDSQNGQICQTCDPKYILNGQKDKCESCQVQNCNQCNGGDKNICQQCSTGYKVNSSGQCEIAIEKCLQLDDFNPNKCKKCELNFKVDQSGLCTCKVQFCVDCNLKNESICMKCQDGFSQKNSNYDCECNLSNCLECDKNTFGKCEQCIQGFQLNSNKDGCDCSIQNCSQCDSQNGQICQTCNPKYILNGQKDKCESCQVQNCNSCKADDKNKCQKCDQGYKVNSSGKCEVGIEKCLELNSTDAKKCSKCEENYIFYNDTNSHQCLCKWSNCKNCRADQSDQTKCEACQDGHIWNSFEKNCICNIQNCQVCNENEYGKCLQCKSNFISQDSNRSCQCQVQNCEKCSQDNGKVCTQCQQNYILDKLSQQCMKCQVNNCLECQNDNASQCKICEQNFQTDQNNKCVEKQIQCEIKNCEKCQNKDQNSCQECKTGYKTMSNSNGKNNCIIAIDNCIELNQSNSQQCAKCSPSYTLDTNAKCQLECNLVGCKVCDSQNNNICKECHKNFILNEQTTSCELCKIENCKICSSQLKGSCEECDQGYSLQADSNDKKLCKKMKQQQIFTLKQNFTEKGFQIFINFEKVVEFKNSHPTHKELSQIFNFTISNTHNFTYNYSVQSKNQILLEILTEEDWEQETLQLNILDNQFVENNNLSKQNDTLNLDALKKPKKQDKDTSSGAKEAAKTINKIAQSTALPLALFGDLFKVFSVVDATSYIYFLFYINVDHPYNIEQFSKLFGSFQFQYIPNFIMPSIDQEHVIQSPEKFMKNEMDSFFLKNSSHSYSFLVLFLSVYVFLKIISFLPLGRLQRIVKRSIKSEWEFNCFIYAVWIVFAYLSVACALQVKEYEMIDSLSRVSYSFFVITSITLLSVPFIFFYLIYTRHRDLSLPKSQRKRQIAFFSIVRGLKINSINNSTNDFHPDAIIPQSLPQCDPNSCKDIDQQSQRPPSLIIDEGKSSQLLDYPSGDNTDKKLSQSELAEDQKRKSLYNPLCKYTNVFLFARKILFSLIIVMLHDQTYIQLSLLSIINVLLILFFTICKPYIRLIDNINHGLTELLFLSLQIISVCLKNNPESQQQDDRSILGWAYVGICLFLLFIHSIILIIDTAKSAIMFIKRMRKSSKIAPTKFQGGLESKKQTSNKIISSQILENRPSSILTFEGGVPQSVEKALNENEQKLGEEVDIEKKKSLRKPRKFFKRNPFQPKDQQQFLNNLDNPSSNPNSNYNLNIQKINNIGSTNISFNNDASPVKLIKKQS